MDLNDLKIGDYFIYIPNDHCYYCVKNITENQVQVLVFYYKGSSRDTGYFIRDYFTPVELLSSLERTVYNLN